ncbi:glycosyltransferase [Pedobacter sp. BG31]|uniref:glycosyltransferase n=1 Tax=Pedobacter sp. BG31 TaxID=3349697 RepID=UPI0035F379E8
MEQTHVFYFVLANNSMNYGIGSYLNHLVSGLGHHRDIAVTIVHCLDEEHDRFLIEQQNGIRNIYIPKPASRYINIFNSQHQTEKIKYAKRVRTLLEPIFEELCKVVVHFNQSILSFLAEELERSFDLKIVFTVHFLSWQFLYEKSLDEYSSAWQEVYGDKAFQVSIDPNEKIFCRISDQIICLTKAAKNFVCAAYQCDPDKVKLIKNGITLTLPKNEIDKMQLKKQLGFNENDFVLVFVGRIAKSKGIKHIISAVNHLVSHHSKHNIKLLVAGSGNFDDLLPISGTIWNNVIFTGALHEDQLHNAYLLADAGITMSFFEQCSYTALEMLRYDLPIIYANNDGLAEMLDGNPAAFKVDLDFNIKHGYNIDVDSICSHILNLIDKREKGMCFTQSDLKERFAIDLWIRDMLAIYTALSKQIEREFEYVQ